MGDHWFCRMSRQMEPSPYTLGWKMGVTNLMVGGLVGYSWSKRMSSWKMPPSHCVSSGPNMIACQWNSPWSSVSQGVALMPSGFSRSMSLKSFSNRLLASDSDLDDISFFDPSLSLFFVSFYLQTFLKKKSTLKKISTIFSWLSIKTRFKNIKWQQQLPQAHQCNTSMHCLQRSSCTSSSRSSREIWRTLQARASIGR